MEEEHIIEGHIFICPAPNCFEEFDHIYSLWDHIELHEKRKEHLEIMSKTKQNLRITKIRNHKCKCGNSFLYEEDLNIHCYTSAKSICTYRTPEEKEKERDTVKKKFAIQKFIKVMPMLDIMAPVAKNVDHVEDMKQKMELLMFHFDRMVLNAMEEELTLEEIEEQIAQFKKNTPHMEPIMLKFVRTNK
jgi:hypothetical protein